MNNFVGYNFRGDPASSQFMPSTCEQYLQDYIACSSGQAVPFTIQNIETLHNEPIRIRGRGGRGSG